VTAETVGLRSNDQKSYLTLSAAGEVLRPVDRSPAARIEDLLELEQRARVLGRPDLAEWYADRIIDEMLGGAA
jgi:hypothetical protein